MDRAFKAGDALRRAVWDPLRRATGSARSVMLVPDGTLASVNVAALPADRTRFLIETGLDIHYALAERDLCDSFAPHSATGLLAVGNVDYGGSKSARVRFARLDESASELRAVANACGTDATTLDGSRADETLVKERAHGHRVLHFDTHAFLDDRADVDASSAASHYIDDPLLRCGLALANANDPPRDATADDGLLTGAEIASLDLAGTELVVLSACATGTGELSAGEGLLSLDRAFRAAGARATVVSLWPVDDRYTRLWMQEFYRLHLTHNASVGNAANEASRRLLSLARASVRTPPPYMWGAFVARGGEAATTRGE